MRRAVLIAVSLLTLASPAAAQDRASVRALTDRDAIALGDRLTLTVEVRHSPEQTVRWPSRPDSLGPLEVVGADSTQPESIDGHETSVLQYTLTAFDLGELEIPAIEVLVVDSVGNDSLLLSTDPIALAVRSIGIDEGGDIRDLKGPLEIPRNWWLLVPWLLLAIAAVALVYWVYRRLVSRRGDTSQRIELKVPQRPPHEIAYEALERLEARRLLERGEVKQFYVEVSGIVRTYLEARYPIDALEMTSHEVLQELRNLGLPPAVFDLFPPFFSSTDLVKFAKYRPSQNEAKDMIPMARSLIDGTRPPDPAPEIDGDSREQNAEPLLSTSPKEEG